MNQPRHVGLRTMWMSTMVVIVGSVVVRPIGTEIPIAPVPEIERWHAARHDLHEFDVAMLRSESARVAQQGNPVRGSDVIQLAWERHPQTRHSHAETGNGASSSNEDAGLALYSFAAEQDKASSFVAAVPSVVRL